MGLCYRPEHKPLINHRAAVDSEQRRLRQDTAGTAMGRAARGAASTRGAIRFGPSRAVPCNAMYSLHPGPSQHPLLEDRDALRLPDLE